jgi:hypothetical protein
VRVLQRRGGLDLLHEPVGAEDRGELRLQKLECDVAAVLEVRAEIHGRHTALTKVTLDAVAAGESGIQRVGLTRHCAWPMRGVEIRGVDILEGEQ